MLNVSEVPTIHQMSLSGDSIISSAELTAVGKNVRYIGNLLYQCNNFAGGIDAVFAIPGMGNLNPDGVRVVGCFIYGALVLAILYMDKVDVIGVGLGVVMMAMIGLFLAAATTVGFSGYSLLLSLVPSVPGMSSLPHAAAPCEMILSFLAPKWPSKISLLVWVGAPDLWRMLLLSDTIKKR